MFGEEEIVKAHRSRAEWINNIMIFTFVVILIRLWYLQIYKGDELLKYSLQNRLRREVIMAPRGMIYSRDSQLLVHNVPRFDAVITPQYLQNKKETIAKLAPLISMTSEQVEKVLLRNSTLPKYRGVIIKKNISRDEVSLIETESFHLPGVSVETVISREYTDTDVGAHMLGYISEISDKQLPKLRERDQYNYRQGDFIGQFGIEEVLDLTLRGEDGYDFEEVDAFGRRKKRQSDDPFYLEIDTKKSTPGKNLILTIDRDVQLAAYAALEGKAGSVVMIDIETGEVIAMVSRPAFDPSQFSRGISSKYWGELRDDPLRPMRDRSIQEHYSPGSVFKTITSIAALEEGLIDVNTEVNCPGSFKSGNDLRYCWKKEGHGPVNVYRAIKESCDVFYYKLATRIDIDVLARYARMMGFGTRTGIQLPREIPGLIPSRKWKKEQIGQEWQQGETLSCVIGQSYILATPIQMALAYSTIANKGKLMRPYLVKEVIDNEGNIVKKYQPEQLSDIKISDNTIKVVKEALYDVVNHPSGTAYARRGEGIRMSGKTGTTQLLRLSRDKLYGNCKDFEYRFRHHGFFVGYAPFENPKVAFAVATEHTCGSKYATPIAESVVTSYMKKYHPDLQKKYAEEEKASKGRVAPVFEKHTEDEAPALDTPTTSPAASALPHLLNNDAPPESKLQAPSLQVEEVPQPEAEVKRP